MGCTILFFDAKHLYSMMCALLFFDDFIYLLANQNHRLHVSIVSHLFPEYVINVHWVLGRSDQYSRADEGLQIRNWFWF